MSRASSGGRKGRPPSSLSNRVHQFRRLLDTEGPSGIIDRVRGRIAERLRPAGARRLVVDSADFERAAELAADGWSYPPPLPWNEGEPMKVGFVCTPPAPGSGGHTTMFRMIAALERAGHRCVVYLQDQHGWSIDEHQEIVRKWWPWVRAEIRDFDQGIAPAHALFATGWGTAYALLQSDAPGLRCYFVQDFEPSFSPAGSEYLIAESTYRFGFFGVTVGAWLSQLLDRDYGMRTEAIEFGCDLDKYGLDRSIRPSLRNGVCYYCRPSTPRRAHELAVFALQLFAARHPEVEIHFYGEEAEPLSFPITHHGLLTPTELGELYNRCVAGLVLSATNVSLVPYEMLAAGCIPVVNEAEQNRIVLDNPHVRYALPTPYDLAAALSDLVEQSEFQRTAFAEQAAGSVQGITWDEAGQEFERILRVELSRVSQ